MQKAKRITILIFLLLFVIYFSWTAFMFSMLLNTIPEEVTYFSNNSSLILETLFVFLLPILGLLSIVFNLRIYQSLSIKHSIEILDETRKIRDYKNYFLLNVYFVFSIIFILHVLLRAYKLSEIVAEIGIFNYYLKIQALILFVIVLVGIVFLVDTIKLRKKHIKS